jgi:hypothetical protein
MAPASVVVTSDTPREVSQARALRVARPRSARDMLISNVPAPHRRWVFAEVLNGNALSWCPTCRLVRPADLTCSRCGSPTEAITVRAERTRRPS